MFFPTLTESFAECVVVVIIIIILPLLFSRLVLSAHPVLQNVVSRVRVPRFPALFGCRSVEETSRDFIFCCVCAAALSEFVHFVDCAIVCVSLCVHASVFHLTIHPGPRSICLSDHLM